MKLPWNRTQDTEAVGKYAESLREIAARYAFEASALAETSRPFEILRDLLLEISEGEQKATTKNFNARELLYAGNGGLVDELQNLDTRIATDPACVPSSKQVQALRETLKVITHGITMTRTPFENREKRYQWAKETLKVNNGTAEQLCDGIIIAEGESRVFISTFDNKISLVYKQYDESGQGYSNYLSEEDAHLLVAKLKEEGYLSEDETVAPKVALRRAQREQETTQRAHEGR
jgi:hypothetical protein